MSGGFVDIDVAELSGVALDWAVGMAEGQMLMFSPPNYRDVYIVGTETLYRPSTDWGQGGPLIKAHQIDIQHLRFVQRERRYTRVYATNAKLMKTYIDDDELVAACRVVVASRLGESVKVPVLIVPK